MFDKLYKEANDEIPVNTKLMQQLKAEAAKERKKNPYSFMYKIGLAATATATAAAAVVIVVVSLNVLPGIVGFQSSGMMYPGTDEKMLYDIDMHENDTAYENMEKSTEEELQEPVQDDGVAEKQTGDGNETEQIDSQQDGETENSDNLHQHENENPDETPVQQENMNEGNESSNESEEDNSNANAGEPNDAAEDEPSSYDGYAGGSGGSGGAVVRYGLVPEPRMISFDDYCMEYAFLPQRWRLPEGMIMVEGDRALLEPGADDYGVHAVRYSGNGKEISFTLYPESDEILEYVRNEDGEKNRPACLISEESDMSYTVHLVRNGNGYIIKTKNIEKKRHLYSNRFDYVKMKGEI